MFGAIGYNQQDIVKDGLVLWLDANDKTSYPGTGTVWRDLSRSSSSGSLLNSPGFSNNNGGNIVFDGSNDFCNFVAPNLTSTTTVEVWANLGAGYSGKMVFGWLLYDVWCGSGNLGFNTANGDVYGISSATVSSLGLVNNWKHYIFEMRSDVSYTNNKIYINGVSQTLSQQLNSENSSFRNFNGGSGRIACWLYDNDYPMPMNCALFKIYNRALNQTEITQNFNALRSRFGI